MERLLDGLSRQAELHQLFPGDSELAWRMRGLDWSASPLGPVERWPNNLRIALGVCLTSRFPLHVWWGPSLTLFYNDAYISFLGRSKHPNVLGRSGREAWKEIWDTIGPMIDRVFQTGEASWSEDILMFFDRQLPREEVYVTFSFSPVPGAGGAVDGLFCACTETTDKLIGNRRLETLRKLGVRAPEALTVQEACLAAAEVLSENAHDVPFAVLFVADERGTKLERAATVGIPEGALGLPGEISLEHPAPDPHWPFEAVVGQRVARDGPDPREIAREVVARPWNEPIHRTRIVPVHAAGREGLAGMMVVGISPRRPLDGAYAAFLDLVAGHVGTAIANARAYEAERRRAESLAEIDRAKTAFFSNVSHEFRTPLTLMLGPLEELLRFNHLHDVDRAPIEVAHRNGLRLLKLVNGLLDFSRIEAGRLRARYAPADLAAFTAELASMFRSALERTGLQLEIDCPPLPEPVLVDHDMWEKIVLTLISNAFKFTFEGGISVSVRAEGGRAVLRVRDTGTGIARKHLPHLFERFFRIAGARARTHEGAGIGLAMLQDLVRLHGGEVTAQSEPGRGSSFAVALPFGSAHLPAGQVEAGESGWPDAASASARAFVEEALRWVPDAPAPGQNGGGQNGAWILLADNNADMRGYVRRLLEPHWKVEAVTDGAAALEAAWARVPDLVIADAMMPNLDGLALLRALRGDPRTKDVPILMVSARAGEEARVDGLEAGADDYLIKPFSARELLARVRTHLELSRMRRERLEEANRQALFAGERAARAEAEHASRMKDEFLARISHELASPIFAIRMSLELLSGEVTERQREPLASLRRSVEAQSVLINDLLDTSRALNGKLRVTPEPLEPLLPVQAAVEALRPQAQKKRIELRLEVGETPLVQGDETRLRQVVSNLLSNAIKFTPEGGRIDVVVSEVDGGVSVAVRDTGRGFPPSFRPLLFSPFRQEEESTVRSAGGLGLGLAIAKQLVELHGGRVRADSPGKGQGATFEVWLPGLYEEAALSALPDVNAPSALDGLRLLLVDDDALARSSLAALLEQRGASVEIATGAAEALEVLRHHRFDVLISDIAMPGEDGYSLIRKVRGGHGLDPAVPAAALTAHMREEDRERALDAGFHAHLPKSVQPSSLIRAVLALARERPPPGGSGT